MQPYLIAISSKKQNMVKRLDLILMEIEINFEYVDEVGADNLKFDVSIMTFLAKRFLLCCIGNTSRSH